jgi:hypothetical protein
MSKYNEMVTILTEAQHDQEKTFDKGNVSAGRRYRKALSNLKKLCDQERKIVIELKKAE